MCEKKPKNKTKQKNSQWKKKALEKKNSLLSTTPLEIITSSHAAIAGDSSAIFMLSLLDAAALAITTDVLEMTSVW